MESLTCDDASFSAVMSFPYIFAISKTQLGI